MFMARWLLAIDSAEIVYLALHEGCFMIHRAPLIISSKNFTDTQGAAHKMWRIQLFFIDNFSPARSVRINPSNGGNRTDC
jgi:hypothetical protein